MRRQDGWKREGETDGAGERLGEGRQDGYRRGGERDIGDDKRGEGERDIGDDKREGRTDVNSVRMRVVSPNHNTEHSCFCLEERQLETWNQSGTVSTQSFDRFFSVRSLSMSPFLRSLSSCHAPLCVCPPVLLENNQTCWRSLF